MAFEPRRLIEGDAAGELRDALEQARAASGSSERVARLWQRLELGAAAPGASTNGGGASTGHGLTGAAAVKGVVVVAALVLGAGGARLLLSERTGGADVGTTPRASVAAPAPRVDVAPAQSDVADAVQAVQMAPAAQPESEAVPRLRTPPRRPLARAAAPVVSGQDSAEAEIALLTRAEQTIAKQPGAALAILAEHAQRFPHGMLVEEREVLRVDAELALGRRTQAAARARRFLSTFPSSSHRRRFEQLLAESEHKPGALPLPTE